MLRGPSSTSSAMAVLRRTGRQCIRRHSGRVSANQSSRTHQSVSARAQPRIRRRVAVGTRWRPIPSRTAPGRPAAPRARSLVSRTEPPQRGGAPRALHDRRRQREAFGAQHRHVHAAQRRHVQRRCRHGERQRARVVGPGEHEARRGAAPHRSSSVFQSASAWQGWLRADSRLIRGLSMSAAMRVEVASRPGRLRGPCPRRTRGCRAHRSRRRAPGSPRARARRRRRP